MARPSKWRLAPVDRISVPTVLAASFEALAVAVDKNEPEIAREILGAVLQKHCQPPEPAPQESTFTIPAPALPGKRLDPHNLLLEEDDEPIPEAVLLAAFQPMALDSKSDQQVLVQDLAQSNEAAQRASKAPGIAAITVPTSPEPVSGDAPTTTQGAASAAAPLETLPNEPAAVASPTVQSVATEPAEPAEPEPSSPIVNLDAVADPLPLIAASSQGTQKHTVETTPETSLATRLSVQAETQAVANGLESVTIEDPVTVTQAEAAVAVKLPENGAVAMLETVTEGIENGAIETPTSEPAALPIDSVTEAETVLPVAQAPTVSAVTLNHETTVVAVPTPTPFEGIEGFRQASASPTLDLTKVALAPVALTTTSESIEPPTAAVTSYRHELSTPIEGLPPKLEPAPSVEAAMGELEPETRSFRQSFVAPEPGFHQSNGEPQNDCQERPMESVNTTATDLELPEESDQTANIQPPLGYGENSDPTSIKLPQKLPSPDQTLTNDSTSGAAMQGLKTAVALEQWAPVIPATNAVGVSGTNESTVAEPLTETPLAETFVESANVTAAETAVTPTTSLPEPPSPVDRVQALADFAEALFKTWQALTLAKRGELALCWGLNVSFEYLYREGFKHMTAYRFFALLEALLQSATDYEYGCLQVSHRGQMESAMLQEQSFNQLTFYAPGTPKHAQNQTAFRQAQTQVTLQPTESSEQELERIRQERLAHIASVEQHKVKEKGQQGRAPNPGGLFGALTQLATAFNLRPQGK